MTETITKYRATGRRKKAIASAVLSSGKGNFVVNGQSFETYFQRETDRLILKQPLEATKTVGNFDIKAKVVGGGKSGQAGALRLGISRALSAIDESYKLILRKGGYLTRDPRAKERKKYGLKGARKRFQWTKR